MITSPVTIDQLKKWKDLSLKHGPELRPNRISGAELDQYFCRKYHPEPCEDEDFDEVVRLNALDYAPEKREQNVKTYRLGEVYMGIDLNTGFFHVECEDISKCAAVYDDLFVARGLDEEDLKNYVLVGQYLELK